MPVQLTWLVSTFSAHMTLHKRLIMRLSPLLPKNGLHRAYNVLAALSQTATDWIVSSDAFIRLLPSGGVGVGVGGALVSSGIRGTITIYLA